MQKHLIDHGLGHRAQRVARAAAITAGDRIRFVDRFAKQFRCFGVSVTTVLSGNGPECAAAGFRTRLAITGIDQVRVPPR